MALIKETESCLNSSIGSESSCLLNCGVEIWWKTLFGSWWRAIQWDLASKHKSSVWSPLLPFPPLPSLDSMCYNWNLLVNSELLVIFRDGGRERKLSLDFFSAWLSALLRGNNMRWHWEEMHFSRICCFECLYSCSTGARLIHSSAMIITYCFIQ